MKKEVVAFYRSESSMYESYQDNDVVDMQLGSIVMQMVGVIMTKGSRGQLWISSPDTEGRRREMKKDKEERLKSWVQNLDFNLLSCDDASIIQKILMRVGSEFTFMIDYRKFLISPRLTFQSISETMKIV